jgi:enoyl-CoA hydratase
MVDRDSRVASVLINRPDRRNAINLAMWVDLAEIARSVQNDPDVRVIVIRGAGREAFSAGGDVSEFTTARANRASGVTYNRTLRAALDAFAELSKPVVAAIRGYCLGGGCALAMTADFRISDSTACFAIPAARMGFSLDPMDVQRLVRLVGRVGAAELLLAGRTVSADHAKQIGLVSDVADPEDLDRHVDDLLADLMRAAPLALAATKRDLQLVQDEPTLSSISDRDSWSAQLLDTADYQEGVRAMLEKRRPQFKGH